jgi:hypothetical protein
MGVKNLVMVTLKKRTAHFLLFALVLFVFPLKAQDEREIEVTAQSILARVDQVMEYPRGLIRGRMKHIHPDGKSYTVEITGKVAPEDYIFTFSSKSRGDELKVLYNLRGEDIWVYNIHSIRLYHKMGIDRFDEVLSTNFTFLDLSNADLQSNYTADIKGIVTIKGKESYKLHLQPIFRGGKYGMLTLFVSREDLLPLRIDFHDRDNAIFKFMTLSKVRYMDDRIIPIRYDMMNIRQGTVTILSFYDFEREATFDPEIFRSKKLGSQ